MVLSFSVRISIIFEKVILTLLANKALTVCLLFQMSINKHWSQAYKFLSLSFSVQRNTQEYF
jgi:hypothetical protein